MGKKWSKFGNFCLLISKLITEPRLSRVYGKNRHADEGNGTECPEINFCIYSHLRFDKRAKGIRWGQISSSTNGAGETGYLHEERGTSTLMSHDTNELIQNGL